MEGWGEGRPFTVLDCVLTLFAVSLKCHTFTPLSLGVILFHIPKIFLPKFPQASDPPPSCTYTHSTPTPVYSYLFQIHLLDAYQALCEQVSERGPCPVRS